MNSLRIRLLTAMLITIAAFGSVWYLARAWDMRQPETGYWDSRLRGIGRLIVSSMPSTLTAGEGAVPAYHLADIDKEPIDDMAFQVWNLRTRKLLMRSPSAPDAPMRPDFSPGFDESHFAGQNWRVYTVVDDTGSVQVQVAKSQQELDETYQTWRLIADAAHELRTPLAAIQAQAQLAAGAQDAALSHAAAVKLQTVAARAARLVEQLLDQARLETDDAWPMETLDLADLADLIVRDFEGSAQRKAQHIALNAESCTLRGNVDSLGILLSNLLDNAIRYTPAQGHIAVSCRIEDGRPCLEVADDGPGVAAPDRARIFEPFFRVAGSGERGTGLGLSLVARIAAMHGAVIDDRTAARGLHLVIRFPATAPEAA
ncbi:sensor histidine kinase KdpD [Bordetella sp. N]|uniref:sensor histidine kinase n=1 Tax=Bordetella sp. N TaxID=1746199 RepID=UPI00070C8A68|nr:HAMP domain-containing sensor histidine kinase [Bordetella sp. N]ALM85630.1 hypothetical protein ASB57_24110 [Bordetella sp. N]